MGFPNSTHLIVENGGHEMLPDPEVQSVIVGFFKGRDVSGRKVSFPRPRFVSPEQAESQEKAPADSSQLFICGAPYQRHTIQGTGTLRPLQPEATAAA